MKRLKKWIDEIRAERSEYASEYWMCRYSGDTAEFLIHPHVVFQTERFKHTVIRIGMMLKRLSEKMEQAGYVYHIQTFPSFDDLKTVASIRLNINISQGKSRDQKPTSESGFKNKMAISYNEVLHEKAKQHNLQLIPIENEDEFQTLESSSGKVKVWHVIGGHHDNPFAWLHSGFLTEELYQLVCTSGCDDVPEIISGPELSNFEEKLKIPNPPAFIHALIAIRCESKESNQA